MITKSWVLSLIVFVVYLQVKFEVLIQVVTGIAFQNLPLFLAHVSLPLEPNNYI